MTELSRDARRPLKLALIQMRVGDEDKAERLARAEYLLGQTAGADLVLLPELWNVGYFAFERYALDAEPMDGPTVRAMRAKAAELKTCIMMGSFLEKNAEGLRNTSVFITPRGEIAACYRKVHLFGYGSQERRLLVPGRDVVSAATEKGVFGLSTCFDLRFPELYRRLLDAGAEMLLVSSAWPHPRLEHWRVLTRARAIENQCFLAAANCAGTNRGSRYCGHSVVLNPYGEVLAEAGEGETILKADIDLGDVSRARAEFPAVRSRVL
ncbi:MAG TPA: carbon-nitrogen family hydrolase [Elusimicrobiota bacterium]|nr:carbon-nitrogen family hydrolase [Elusimicrobiota bacterium]